MPVGFPKTDSGIEISLLENLFTPEEAFIATKLNFMPVELKKIQRRVKKINTTRDTLKEKLDTMFKKGLIMKQVINKEPTYYNVPLVIGMWEYQLGRLNPEIVNDIYQYFDEAYFEKGYNKTGIPQFRTIPIEQAITHESNVATYDQVRTLINNSDVIGLMDCICRKAHDLIGDPCKKTDLRETCITFGFFAKMRNKNGLARLITKNEALELLDNFEDVGLVLQTSNSQKPFVICSCCGCCCEFLSSQRKFNNPVQFFATNFYAVVNLDECIGCGTCVERCNMDAKILKDDKCKVDLGRCIGCGLCVPTCPQEAIKLEKKKKETIPPKDTVDTYTVIMNKKAELSRASKK